jgi:potassium-dependent mechanosensitive channel
MIKILNQLYRFFTKPLFNIGDSSVSLESILILVFFLVILIAFIRILNNWLRNKLFVKIGLEPGLRDVIATIVSYGIGILGFIIILQSAGIKLDSLTFLAGGLGIGIGFGLQDISQNFVSGITLLFERQIKVGDRIIVDEQEGVVQNISIRSTVIKIDNGSNVIIPNQSLITAKIVNFSAGEPKRRIRIPFVVQQNADPLLVVEVLLNAAYRETSILTEPPPQVLLKDFYNNDGLNFEMLVWINSEIYPEQVISPINYLVNYEFNQLGINTPASQREISFEKWEEIKEIFNNINNNMLINNKKYYSENSPIKPIDNNETPSIETEKTPPIQSTISKPTPLALSDLLRKVVYFENFTEIDMLHLIANGRRQTLSKDKIVFKENDPGNSFNIILSGEVEVFLEKANKHLTNLKTGDFFGELALIMGIPRTASVRTVENTTMFVVTREGFQKLLSSYPDLGEQIAQKLAERKEELVNRQQLLRQLGLLDDTDLNENPLNWIRKRMTSLFGI